MCGLTGFWNFSTDMNQSQLTELARLMADVIKSRGPDSRGEWADETRGIAFGHRRLAIVDLSEAGHQPMSSHSGRFVLSYNGEIYNANELRAELMTRGSVFRGSSDTEVIIEACETWGVQQACKRFIGMFALSLWDNQEHCLSLVRDRLGIKPMYWGFHRGVFFFGSQLKSFSKHPNWDPVIDRQALTAYCRFNYIPAPYSIYEGIYKLIPGSILTIHRSQKIEVTPFWDPKNYFEQSNDLLKKSDLELIDELDLLLQDAIQRRMLADVPLGAFLSGGVDSSTVVAMMQSKSSLPIKTFSIGFHESDYNESRHAALVAKHLKTDHHEMMVSAADAQSIIPDIPLWCDEPFADVSQIPTYLVSKLAREQVTIALSGDGGDELFAGYNRYVIADALWGKLHYVPQVIRKCLSQLITSASEQTWDNLARVMPERFRPQAVGDKIYKLSLLISATGFEEFYTKLVSQWQDPQAIVKGGIEPNYRWHDRLFQSSDTVRLMQYIDLISYLPDDILTKVDRASMAVSLEARVPLLDHRIVEWSTKLPSRLKIRNGQSKWILRQVLNRYVPQTLIDRPKMGFGVPIGEWLRGPLKEWGYTLLSRQNLESQGYFNSDLILQRWEEHVHRKRNWQYPLWGILMFQSWLFSQNLNNS